MKTQASFLETVPLAALSPEISGYTAMLILEQPEEALLQALSDLQPQSQYKIAVIEHSLSNTPEQLIEKAREMGLPPVFIQPHPPVLDSVVKDCASFSATLISPGGTSDLSQQLICHPKITNLSWIGYQTYLSSPELFDRMQTRYFSPLRLGCYRENFKAAEPLIRPNGIHFIDLNAVRHSDAPEGAGGPNGLYAEEICQLSRYIGVSSHIDACFIYGYPKKSKAGQIIIQLLAQTLWHLFESLATRQNEDPYQQKQQTHFTSKEVYMGDSDHILNFLYSNQTGRWWIEIKSGDGSSYFIPCTADEYATALKGELPFTWLRHYQKINSF